MGIWSRLTVGYGWYRYLSTLRCKQTERVQKCSYLVSKIAPFSVLLERQLSVLHWRIQGHLSRRPTLTRLLVKPVRKHRFVLSTVKETLASAVVNSSEIYSTLLKGSCLHLHIRSRTCVCVHLVNCFFFFHLEWLCSQCYRKVCLRLSVHDRCISFS